MDISVHKTEEKLIKILEKISDANKEIAELSAVDFHGLCKCQEVKSFMVCAEMIYRAAMIRSESRGFHYRIMMEQPVMR